jgi:predicted  nucleic acid-binding Zn-ribbon protein
MTNSLVVIGAGVLFSFILGTVSGYKWQENVYERKIAKIREDYDNSVQDAIERTRQNEKHISEKYEEALRKSNTRISAMARDINSTRATLVGLRHASENAARNAETSLTACITTTNTFRVVFESCAAEYESLGAEAQGHVIDKQSLIESWPTLVTDDHE